jgi:putative N6-adenine-specific DNA methylase
MPSSQQTPLTPNGLRRRLKRHVLKAEHAFFAICQPGFEAFLTREVGALSGAVEVEQSEGGVSFRGPLDLTYLANLHLRTAVRVLIRVASFRATSFPELHNKSRRVRWELWIGMADSVAYDISAKRSRVMHERKTRHAVHEALTRTMGELGRSVDDEPESPVRIHIRMHEDLCTLSLDTSGDLLYKRGYRISSVAAPIRETSAAALLMAAGYNRSSAIVDPMCGSGTFLIEAARMLRGIPPGVLRSFAFESLPWFNPPVWQRMRTLAAEQIARSTPCRLLGFDRDARAVDAARENAARGDAGHDIEFAVADARVAKPPHPLPGAGLLICNLPYGKRAADLQAVRELYPSFGAHVKRAFPGWRYGFVVPRGADKLLGLTVEESVRFVNGGIPVVFVMGTLGGDCGSRNGECG